SRGGSGGALRAAGLRARRGGPRPGVAADDGSRAPALPGGRLQPARLLHAAATSRLIEVGRLDAAAAERDLDALALILAETVEGGASVGFVTPFSTGDAAAWWRSLLPDVAAGRVLLLGPRVQGAPLGTVH